MANEKNRESEDLKWMQNAAVRDSEKIIGEDMSEEEKDYYKSL